MHNSIKVQKKGKRRNKGGMKEEVRSEKRHTEKKKKGHPLSQAKEHIVNRKKKKRTTRNFVSGSRRKTHDCCEYF